MRSFAIAAGEVSKFIQCLAVVTLFAFQSCQLVTALKKQPLIAHSPYMSLTIRGLF